MVECPLCRRSISKQADHVNERVFIKQDIGWAYRLAIIPYHKRCYNEKERIRKIEERNTA